MTTTTLQTATASAVEAAKAEYRRLCGNDDHWGDISNAYVLETGQIFVFYKPAIVREFCYSEDGSEKDVALANKACASVKTEEGFIEENLRKAYRHLDRDLAADYLFAFPTDWGSASRFVNLTSRLDCLHWVADEDVIQVSDRDREKLKAVLADEKEKFTKRLRTYFKRYGHCVRAWTYWAWA